MKKRILMTVVLMMLLTSYGCIWWDHDRGYYDDHDRGGHEEHERHGDHRDHDDRR